MQSAPQGLPSPVLPLLEMCSQLLCHQSELDDGKVMIERICEPNSRALCLPERAAAMRSAHVSVVGFLLSGETRFVELRIYDFVGRFAKTPRETIAPSLNFIKSRIASDLRGCEESIDTFVVVDACLKAAR
jgi:hypothetical protein